MMIKSSRRAKERIVKYRKTYERVQEMFEDYKKRVTENQEEL